MAFASGGLNNCIEGCQGDFRVAQLAFCASVVGDALVHWQFYPALGNGYVWALRLLAPWVRQYYTDHFSRHGPPTPPVRQALSLRPGPARLGPRRYPQSRIAYPRNAR